MSSREWVGCRRGIRSVGFLGVVLAAFALNSIPADAAKQRGFKEIFGSAAQPSFVQDMGLAVDQVNGDLLVVDAGSQTISRFKPNGEPDPFSALASNVIDGKGSGDETPQNGLKFGTANEVQVAIAPPGSVAGTAGDIYITQAGASLIDIFAPDGHYLGQLTQAGASNLLEPCGVTVDETGSVYVGDYKNNKVFKFSPTANPPLNTNNVSGFSGAIEHPCTMAAGAGASAGSVFAAGYNALSGAGTDRPVHKLDSATGEVEFDIESRPTTVAVDPSSGNVLLAERSEIVEYDASGRQMGLPVELGGLVEGIAVRGAGNAYVSRRIGTGGEQFANVEVFGSLEPIPPQIKEQWAVEVGPGEATLKIRFGPEESGTSYHVEYGLDTSYGLSSPLSTAGASGTVTVKLTGLQAGATYHWHVVASSAGGSTLDAPDRIFNTYPLAVAFKRDCPNQAFRSAAASFLPDCRAFEMVSPVDKNGGGIEALFTFDSTQNRAALDQSSSDGDGITYSTKQAFGDAVGAPYSSQYISRRDPVAGWWTHAVNAPHEGFPGGADTTALDGEFVAFSADLSEAWMIHQAEPPLALCAPTGSSVLYHRDNVDDSYEALHCEPNRPFENAHHTIELVGLSGDGCRAVFRSNSKLTADAGAGGAYRLFESSCEAPAKPEGPLRLVSLLPNGTRCPLGSTAGSSGEILDVNDGRDKNVWHAFSTDAHRLYWSCGSTLYLRTDPDLSIEGDEVTIQISTNAIFQWAPGDGKTALFKTSNTLKSFDAESQTSTTIAEGMMRNVLGAGEDATGVYFASNLVLAPGAVAGQPNLYLWRAESITLTFIATLAAGDLSQGVRTPSPIYGQPNHRASRVTPDGLHAVFVSTAPLTGFDNTDAISGQADAEVFLFDAGANGGAGELMCISCNPSGVRPTGRNLTGASFEPFWAAAWIPGWQSQLYQGRPLSDDGRRLFFNSYEALIPRDTNSRQDVYEWERVDSEGETAEEECEELGAELYVADASGCISLISSGQDPSDSEFIDADPEGEDVFIRTDESLLTQDPGLLDVYDARVGGGFPEPVAAKPSCEGEACQSPPAPPVFDTPASSAYVGSGDAKPGSGCPRGKRKISRKGKARCVAKHKRHKRRHQRAHREQGRAAR